MNYLETLTTTADRFSSIVCLGLDPVIDEIPLQTGTIRERIIFFYEQILNQILKKKIYPASVKPNYAFYARYGMEGIEALQHIIGRYRDEGIPVILDVKRGDIGKTAAAYADEAFSFFKADAVTLAPYMGLDSIKPFIDHSPDKGYYVLNRTSNKSAVDIQDLEVNGEPLYIKVSRKILDWYHPGIGAVVGATYTRELSEIMDVFSSGNREVPLLIPGVGTQGGSASEVTEILRKYGDIRIHRINSSSGINYAYKRFEGMHFADAAVKALNELNQEIGL